MRVVLVGLKFFSEGCVFDFYILDSKKSNPQRKKFTAESKIRLTTNPVFASEPKPKKSRTNFRSCQCPPEKLKASAHLLHRCSFFGMLLFGEVDKNLRDEQK